MVFPLALLGPIISAGATVAGALMQPKETSTKTTSEVDYQKMVDSATAAGFNPLTALRNGGSAGFSTSTTRAPTASALPQALASVGGILGDAFQNQFDPLVQKKRQLDTALVDYQLRQMKNLPDGSLYQAGNTYGVKVSRANVLSPPKFRAEAKDNMPGQGIIVGGKNPEASSLGWGNNRYGWFHNPNWPDAAQWENIYGDSEIGSMAYGLGKFSADGIWSLRKNFGAYVEDVGRIRRTMGSALPQKATALSKSAAQQYGKTHTPDWFLPMNSMGR